MYCKRCGKEIADNSVFCQFCGEQLESGIGSNTRLKKSFIPKFKDLSKGWQICTMSYITWVFLWLILWLTDSDLPDYYLDLSNGSCFLIFAIVIPIESLFVWFSITHFRKPKNRNDSDNKVVHSSNADNKVDFSNSANCVITPLLLFASTHGKMQIKTERNINVDAFSYCVFTNTNGECTKVEFCEYEAVLSAAEIAANKDSIFIVERPYVCPVLIRL